VSYEYNCTRRIRAAFESHRIECWHCLPAGSTCHQVLRLESKQDATQYIFVLRFFFCFFLHASSVDRHWYARALGTDRQISMKGDRMPYTGSTYCSRSGAHGRPTTCAPDPRPEGRAEVFEFNWARLNSTVGLCELLNNRTVGPSLYISRVIFTSVRPRLWTRRCAELALCQADHRAHGPSGHIVAWPSSARASLA